MGKCKSLHGVILRVGSSVQLCHPGSRALLTVRVKLGTGLCLGKGLSVTHPLATGIPVWKGPGCECLGDELVLRCCRILGF